MSIQSINPATGNLLRSFTPLSEQAVEGKIALALVAFRAYRQVSLEVRSLWMKKLAGILEREADELAILLTNETGKPITASRTEIVTCASCCRYFGEQGASLLADEAIAIQTHNCMVRWDPLGVVLGVMLGNSPFWQAFRFLAPALMGGNVALLNHAANLPQSAIEIELLVRRAGFAQGTVQTLLAEPWQVELVLKDERVAALTMAGPEGAGRALAAQAGWLMKKSLLKLGGSDPFVVMSSANLGAAVQRAVNSQSLAAEQTCLAATRFIVHETVYETFAVLLAAAVEEVRVGNPMKDETECGPLPTEQALRDMEAHVTAAVSAGGHVLAGGQRMLGVGNFFEPTLIANVPRTAAVARAEICGPVAFLFKAGSFAEAIEIANDTPYGSGASVWTDDVEEQHRFVAELECGSVFVNTTAIVDPRLPSGGIKRSGYGRELSAAGMREFLNAKTVVIAKQASEEVTATNPASREPQLQYPDAPSSEPDAFDADAFRRVLESALQDKSAKDHAVAGARHGSEEVV